MIKGIVKARTTGYHRRNSYIRSYDSREYVHSALHVEQLSQQAHFHSQTAKHSP